MSDAIKRAQASQQIWAQANEITRLRAENERLREALAPFAKKSFDCGGRHILEREYVPIKCLLDARAALEGVTQPASPWFDIESAPRDGTPILCVKQGSGFHPEILGFEGGVFGWLNEDMSFSYNPDNQPTHWMPLQEPPR